MKTRYRREDNWLCIHEAAHVVVEYIRHKIKPSLFDPPDFESFSVSLQDTPEKTK